MGVLMKMKASELSQNIIEIDKDRFDFLMYAYFGADENPYCCDYY